MTDASEPFDGLNRWLDMPERAANLADLIHMEALYVYRTNTKAITVPTKARALVAVNTLRSLLREYEELMR